MIRRLLPLLFLALLAVGVEAKVETYQFDDAAQEARYKHLVDELRCLVCQNQNLADSNAELAQDLRRQTYDMVKRGASNEEVVTYMVERYGDFVLYRPPFRTSTLLLWVGPFIILGIAFFLLIGFIRRRAHEKAPEMSAEDLARAESLLKRNNKS